MDYVNFRGVNAVLRAPKNWDTAANGPCGDLPVCAHDHGLTSVWKPSPEELAALNAGGGVMLTIASSVHPPVMMQVIDFEALDVRPQ